MAQLKRVVTSAFSPTSPLAILSIPCRDSISLVRLGERGSYAPYHQASISAADLHVRHPSLVDSRDDG
jgi:hypothetical protein